MKEASTLSEAKTEGEMSEQDGCRIRNRASPDTLRIVLPYVLNWGLETAFCLASHDRKEGNASYPKRLI